MLFLELCEHSHEVALEASIRAPAGEPIEIRLEGRGCPSRRRQPLTVRKGYGAGECVVLVSSWLALRSGALVRPLFPFRLIRLKAEPCPHGRVIAQSLLAPLMVVVAFQDFEMP